MRGLIVAVLVLSGSARADDGVHATAEPPSKHLVYVELLGKGGLCGVGYEYAITDWLGFGGPRRARRRRWRFQHRAVAVGRWARGLGSDMMRERINGT